MLKTLKFVQGAVSKKDFLPAMTHFAIEGGFVRSYNGVLALGSPIPFNIDCKPKASVLVQAIARCEDAVALQMMPSGKLRIKSGSFTAMVECVQEETQHVGPEGDPFELDGAALIKALEVLEPFIGDDASRPWTNGVLLCGQSAFATNNVCLVEYWVGSVFPHVVNLPRVAVKELLRIGEAPTHGQLGENSITFHFSDGRWVRSQLFSTEWPDLTKILNKECQPVPVDQSLFAGLDVIRPFVDKMGRVFIEGGVIATHKDGLDGATYDAPTLTCAGVYNIKMIGLLKDRANTIDWSAYPNPCLFFGDRLRGAIVGMRL